MMKRLTVVFIILAFLLAAANCGKPGASDTPEKDKKETKADEKGKKDGKEGEKRRER